jgi:phytol kinase
MNTALQLVTVFALILGLLGTMAWLSRLAHKHEWHPEVARKIVHVMASGIAIPLPWLFAAQWPVWLLLGLALTAMLAMRTTFLAGPGRALHSVERDTWGDVLLVVSVGLLFLLFKGEPILYVLPLLVLALADAAAALTGSTYGRNFYVTEDGMKSIEGSTMFFLVTLILAMISLLLLTDIERGTLIFVALGISVFATVIEADSWSGFDNLFLPMGVFLFLFNIVGWQEEENLVRLLVPTLAMPLAYGLSRAIGMKRQVSRIHAVALFLILSATNVVNAFLPGLVLLIHALVSRQQQETQPVDETLSVVTGLALVSFGFLALDISSEGFALDFYQLACGAMAVIYISRGLRWEKYAGNLFGALFAAGFIWVLWYFVTGTNSAGLHLRDTLVIPAAALMTVAALAPVIWPKPFRDVAGIRIALLAAAPTLGLFGICLLLGSGKI